MRKRKLKMASGIFLLLLIAGLSGCGQKNTEKENLCHIVLEAGEGYHVTDPARTIKSGSDVSFTITLDDNWQFLGTDYHGETEITKEDDGKTVNLVLHEVNYSESICIQAEKGKYEIVYDANGGQNISGDSDRVSICYRGTHQQMEPDRQWGSEAGPNGKKDLCCMHNGFPGQARQILYTKKCQALQS